MSRRGERQQETPSGILSVATLLSVVAGVFTVFTFIALRISQSPLSTTFGSMGPFAGYAFMSFCLIPLVFPLICVFSPWPQSIWDYLYTFTSGTLFSYLIPAASIFILTLSSIISKSWREVPVEGDPRITIFVLIFLMVTPAFLSYAMASLAQRERLVQPQYYVDFSPLSLMLAAMAALFMVLKATRILALEPLIFYMVVPTALASLVFAWLGLLANGIATKLPGLFWILAGFFLSTAIWWLEGGIVLF